MLHFRNILLTALYKVFIKPVRLIRCSRPDKARPVALMTVCVQSKLAHHQKFPAHIRQRQIGLSVLICKNPQLADLVCHLVCHGLIIFI